MARDKDLIEEYASAPGLYPNDPYRLWLDKHSALLGEEKKGE